MCNLYSMTRSRGEVARLFRVSHNRAAAFEPLRASFMTSLPNALVATVNDSECRCC